MKTKLHWAAHIAALFCLLWAADRVYIATCEVERIHGAIQSEQLRSDSLLTVLRATRYNAYTYAQHANGRGSIVAMTHYMTRPVSIADGRFADSLYHAIAPTVAWEDSLHSRKP